MVTDPELVARSGAAATALCIAGLALGALALAGWMLNLTVLASLLRDGVRTRPSSGLALVTAGTALWIQLRTDFRPATGAGHLGAILAVTTVLIGAVASIESPLGRPLGIDALFIPATLASVEQLTGLGSYAVVALGAAMLLLRWQRMVPIAQVLGGAAVLGAWHVIAVHLYNVEALQSTRLIAGTGLPTLLGSLAIGSAVVLARPTAGLTALFVNSSAGGSLIRQLLVPVVFLPVLINWLELLGERRGLYPPGAGWVLDAVLTVVLVAAVVLWAALRLHAKDSERQEAVAALHESEERYRRLMETSPDAVMVKARNRIEFANDAALRLLGGAGREEVIGRSPYAFVPAEDQARFEVQYCRLLEHGGQLPLLEQRLLRIDGVPVDVELTASAVDIRGRRLAHVVARDVTERRRQGLALRESERRFRLIAETITEVFWIADAQVATTLYVSPAYERIWGRSQQSLYENPKSFMETIHPEDVERVRRVLVLHEPDQPFEHEYRIIRPDGEIRWIWDRGFPVRDESGRVLHFVGVAQDITGRKRNEENLRLAVERFELAARATGQGVWELDLTTNVSWWADSYYSQYGYPRDTVPSYEAWMEHIHPDDRDRVTQGFRRAVEHADDVWHDEYRFKLADGTFADVVDRAYLMRDEAGNPCRIVGAIENVTERKRALELVRLNEQRFRATFEQAAVGMSHVAIGGRFLRVNARFCAMLGYLEWELLQRSFEQVIHPDDQPAELEQRRRLLAADIQTYTVQMRHLRSDGSTVWVESTVSLVRDADNEPEYFLVVTQDLTERRQLLDQLVHAQRIEAIGQLAGGIAHDFNNILTVIRGEALLVRDDQNLSPENREAVQLVVDAADRAAALTGKLLLLSRRQSTQPRRLDLNEVVGGLRGMLTRVIREDLQLQFDLERYPLRLHADASMLEQVLLNLVVNARDATPTGGQIRITTRRRTFGEEIRTLNPEASPGAYVGLIVRDTGTGIPPEALRHILEPFFTTKEPGKGTGLGLATVVGVVKQHRGCIKVRSAPGEGATFEVWLPESPEPIVVPTREFPRRIGRLAGNETVLVVDDDESVRKLTRTALERYGYRVLEAASPAQGLEVWRDSGQFVDLLLCDVIMPGTISSRELAAELKRHAPTLKVLFTSGYDVERARSELQADSSDHLLEKPFTARQLVQAVRNRLDAPA